MLAHMFDGNYVTCFSDKLIDQIIANGIKFKTIYNMQDTILFVLLLKININFRNSFGIYT